MLHVPPILRIVGQFNEDVRCVIICSNICLLFATNIRSNKNCVRRCSAVEYVCRDINRLSLSCHEAEGLNKLFRPIKYRERKDFCVEDYGKCKRDLTLN